MDLPSLIGHRGVAGYAPENSLVGLRRAAALGLDWVEVDTALAGGALVRGAGVPVLMHDSRLERTTNGSGELATLTMEELAVLDSGSWFDPIFAGETVPSLAACLAECAKMELGLDLEIKPTPGTDVVTAQAVIAVLRQAVVCPPLFLSSFSHIALAAAAAEAPEIERGLLIRDPGEGWKAAYELGCFAVLVDDKIMTHTMAVSIRTAGFALACYTVNDPERAQMLRDFGVQCLISDVPDQIR